MSLLLAAGETASAVGQQSGLLTSASGLIFPSAGALALHNSQRGFYGHPVVPPPVSALFDAQMRGFFDYKTLDGKEPFNKQIWGWLLRRQGVCVGFNNLETEDVIDYSLYREGWKAIVESSYTKPGINEAFAARIAGLVNEEQFELMLRRNGCLIDDWRWLVPFYSNRLTADQAIELWRRGRFTDKQLETYLRFLRVGVLSDIPLLKELSNQIPNANDIVRFAIREAFNPIQIKLLGLDKELDQNPDYLDWAKASGLGPVTITNAKGENKTVNFAELYWYAHWELPSPGQAYDFFFKFYDQSRYGQSPYRKYGPEFTLDHLKALLKANDYSPAFRDNLAGAAFLPYTRIDVRRIREFGLISKADVYHNYRASGYDDEHANALTEWTELDVQRKKNNKVRTGTKTELCKAYQIGLVTTAEVVKGLTDVGYTVDEAKGEAGLCQMRWANDFANEAVSVIRQGFMTGQYDEKEATTALTNFDIEPTSVSKYLELWKLRLSTVKRQVMVGTISKWFLDGIIDKLEFVSRLTKLNYSSGDITRIVQAAELEQAKRIAKAQRQAANEAQKIIEKNLKASEKAARQAEQIKRQKDRELQKLLQEQQKTARDALRAFLALRTEANLRSWLSEGTITDDDVRATFNTWGRNPADIERWLNDAHQRG